MSEFERPRAVVPPVFVQSPRPDIIATDDELDSSFEGDSPFPREGLPPGFRMRHDSHYVDQLTSRSVAPQVRLVPLRDVDSARAAEARDIEPLARSIRRVGVLQPVLVRPRAGRFELISGARRLAAAAAAGLTEIPCIVHQVDDARALALAEADTVRPPATQPPAERAAANLATAALAELTHSFDAIGSCLHLLGARDVALRDRVALDLIRTEVFRAGRLVQCLRVVSQDPPVSAVPVSLTRAVEQVLESFAPECRLSGVQVDVETSDSARQVRVDPDLLSLAVTGAFGGMLALVQQARQPSLLVRVASSSSGSSVMLEIAQPHVSPPAWEAGRFFDMDWTDRPGGYQAAAELAAARRIAELHHGGVELVAGEGGGCRLVLLLPTV